VAVYTDVSDEALAAFLTAYELGALVAFRGIAEGVENSNFSLRTEAGDYILTLYERRVDPRDLPWFLGLMRHLAERGLSCPLPVAARDGGLLRPLCGRPAAITTFLPGVWPRRVRTAHCAPLGQALAALHAAAEGYAPERANTLGPESWGPLLARCADRADEVAPGLAGELERALAAVRAAWPGDLPRGHIHADLFPDNVFFLDGRVSGLIDFYFACTDFLAYDLAVCLVSWCFDGAFRLDPARARALLAGYGTGRALTAAERVCLPVLAQGAALRFLLTRLHDWLHTPAGAFVQRKDPREYLTKLRFLLEDTTWHERAG
jgi:homoserine kinase type II